jgi:hypothetical protein
VDVAAVVVVAALVAGHRQDASPAGSLPWLEQRRHQLAPGQAWNGWQGLPVNPAVDGWFSAAVRPATSAGISLRQVRSPVPPKKTRSKDMAVDDFQFGVGKVGRQQAVLVVDEAAALHQQSPGLEAQGGAIGVGHASAAEFDVLDRDVAAAYDPDRLAFGMLAIGIEYRALAQAADSEALLGDDADGALVAPGHHLDHVAVAGGGKRLRKTHRHPFGADGQGLGGGRQGQAPRQGQAQDQALEQTA